MSKANASMFIPTLCALLVSAPGAGFAQEAIAKALDALEGGAASLETTQAAVGDDKKLRPGVDKGAFIKAAVALYRRVETASILYGGLSAAQRKSAEANKVFQGILKAQAVVVRAGAAAPEAFVSTAQWKKVRTLIDRSLEYYQDARKRPDRRAGALHDCANSLERAKKAYKKMSEEERRTPTGLMLKTHMDQMLKALAKERKIEDARAAGAQGAKDLEKSDKTNPVCQSFLKTVQHERGHPIRALIAQKKIEIGKAKPTRDGLTVAFGKVLSTHDFHAAARKAGRQGDAARDHAFRQHTIAVFDKLRAYGDKIGAICDSPEGRGLGVTFCLGASSSARRKKPEDLHKDQPGTWCLVARERDRLLGDMVASYVQAHLGARKPPFGAEKRITTKGRSIFLKDLDWTEANRKALMATYEAVFKAARVDFAPSPALFDPLKKKYADARAGIDKLAPTIKLPAKGPGLAYAGKLAKRAVKKQYKAAKFRKWGMGTAAWKVWKTPLGKPDYRERFGWAHYQIKGESWCRWGFFQVREDYKGKAYQPDDAVIIGDETFMRCL